MMARAELLVAVVVLMACDGAAPTKGELADGSITPDGMPSETLMARGETEIWRFADRYLNKDHPVPDSSPGCVGRFGCACDSNADCDSGFCIDYMGGRVCTDTCIEDCPQGWHCMYTGVFGDPVSVCLSDLARLCRPCKHSTDCETQAGTVDVCVRYGPDGAFCGAACSGAADCPAGFACLEMASTEGNMTTQCVFGGECPCSDHAVTMGLATVCEVEGGDGVCLGERVCTAAGLSACDAPPPAAEVCDGLDNDCDGVADENLPKCCVCGDGIVHLHCETPESCCPDFAICGDGACQCGENPCACPVDCCGSKCGDGKCVDMKDENGEFCCGESLSCPVDCSPAACGNGICDAGENPGVCIEDCGKFVCGNNVCEPGEDYDDCPQDCGILCGNCACDPGEFFSTCPVDCGWCGDGYCSMCQNQDEWDAVAETFLCVDCCEPEKTCKPSGKKPLQCGPDGCGGTCGQCALPQVCKATMCLEDCGIACQQVECGQPWPECPECGQCAKGLVCLEGKCLGCDEVCLQAECGPMAGCDCGGCPAGEKCAANQCIPCAAHCADNGKQCGAWDGCDCGQCGTVSKCVNNQCVGCPTFCAQNGKNCGSFQGCECGGCNAGNYEKCQGNVCKKDCGWACQGKTCGWFSGCLCPPNNCSKPFKCQNNNCVKDCNWACDGKQCGSASGCACPYTCGEDQYCEGTQCKCHFLKCSMNCGLVGDAPYISWDAADANSCWADCWDKWGNVHNYSGLPCTGAQGAAGVVACNFYAKNACGNSCALNIPPCPTKNYP